MRPQHWISEWNDRWKGRDVYVVGTGPSLRAFPVDILRDRPTIGLNMAWRSAPIDIGITIHPDLNIPEFMPDQPSRGEIDWVVQDSDKVRSLPPDQRRHAYSAFYFFEADQRANTQPLGEPSDAGRDLSVVEAATGARLYKWSSISQTAVNLAANMGAKNIILVGCDNTALFDQHHAHDQHTRWLNVPPSHRYRQYYEGLAEVRAALRGRGVNLLSLTPFVSLDRPEEDYGRLLQELELPTLPPPADISPAAAVAPPSDGSRLTALRRKVGRFRRP
jgi:hypothetical protein